MLTAAGAVGLAAAAPAAFLAAFLRSDDGRFFAGTVVDGVDIGGLTPAEALARLEEPWAAYLSNPVAFELNGQLWRPRAADIGLSVDFRPALREAWLHGRSGGLGERVADRFNAPGEGLQPHIQFDPNRLRAYLSEIAAVFDQPAFEASIELGSSGPVHVRPGQPGRVVDIDSGIAAVRVAERPGQAPQTISLTFREDIPRYTTQEAEAAVERLRVMASGPVWLLHGRRGWTIPPQRIREALVVDEADGGFAPRLELNRFNDIFQTIETTLSAESKQTVMEYDEQRDRVLRFEPGHAGQRLDRPALERTILERAADPVNRRAEIPLILLNKEFDLAANPLGLKNLLATGSSLYRGSPDYRQHNIQIGVAKLDGQIVRPGEVFSFNERIGPLTPGEGWQEGSIIVKDKTEQGIGGGICQISTTLFRAALQAGLPIEERWPHLYRVRYYEMGSFPIGFDATVFVPGIDLKFGNDFDSPIMLRTRVNPDLMTLDFELWGADDGRVVELRDHRLWDWEDPPPDEGIVKSEEEPDFEDQVEWAKKGVRASLTRLIQYADGREKSSNFLSTYTAWPNRFIVGIDIAKERFPHAYNTWFDKNPEQAAQWGVSRIPGVPGDSDEPSG